MIGAKNENVVEDIQGAAKVSVTMQAGQRYCFSRTFISYQCNFISNLTSSQGLFCVCFFCFDAYVF